MPLPHLCPFALHLVEWQCYRRRNLSVFLIHRFFAQLPSRLVESRLVELHQVALGALQAVTEAQGGAARMSRHCEIQAQYDPQSVADDLYSVLQVP